jgi:glyoxylase-like metal-dependent hydrolase (beta-lactamase superfamily II)
MRRQFGCLHAEPLSIFRFAPGMSSHSAPMVSRSDPEWLEEVAEGIYCIDCDYVQPRLACAYIIREGNRACFVETNTSPVVPRFLEALGVLGISQENVDWIIPTHVHLDHAGGAGELLRHCENATVLAHPKAARHLIEPQRLIESSKMVYGEQRFARLYGSIIPCQADRLRIMDDDEALSWGERSLRFLHTRGHANHHFCVYDSKSNGLFSGDSFGIAYPDLQRDGCSVSFQPHRQTSTPGAAGQTLDRIRNCGAHTVFLTHFGVLHEMNEAHRLLHTSLSFHEGLLNEARERLAAIPSDHREGPVLESELEGEFALRIIGEWQTTLKSFYPSEVIHERLSMDAELNAAGIVVAAKRRLKRK